MKLARTYLEMGMLQEATSYLKTAALLPAPSLRGGRAPRAVAPGPR